MIMIAAASVHAAELRRHRDRALIARDDPRVVVAVQQRDKPKRERA